MDFVQPTRDQCKEMFSKQIESAVAANMQCCLAYALVGHPYLDIVTVERFAVDMSDVDDTLYERVMKEYSVLVDGSPYHEKFQPDQTGLPFLIKETLRLGTPNEDSITDAEFDFLVNECVGKTDAATLRARYNRL